MHRWWLTMLLSMTPVLAFAAEQPFACNMRALTKSELKSHSALSNQLRASVLETKELPDGYALRMQPELWLPVARWAELERKCCPFFAFKLELESNGGPLWLRITGADGVKPFLREELGF